MPAIVKEVSCLLGGILLIFDIDNPLVKLCPHPTTTTITSGVPTTSTTSSRTSGPTVTTSSAVATVSVGSTTSVVLPGGSSTLTVPTTSTTSTSAATSTGYDAFDCPSGLPYSCTNTTEIANTCCFEYPSGLILQTQFWDTNPATGPDDSWTIHGLWPDDCDVPMINTYTNITQILQAYGEQNLLDYMNEYWQSNSGTAESFWEHEWGKHGTCMSTFDTECYPKYQPGEEVPDFFRRTVSIFQSLPTYSWLADAGFVPSETTQYTAQQFQDALAPHHGGNQVYLGCYNGQIDEIWYYFYVQGSVQDGNLQPTQFGSSTCPSTFYYYPKGYVPPTSTTSAAPTSTTSSACATGTPPPFTGKGYVYVYDAASGSQEGFVISTGKWYTANGTPATYTAAPNADGSFTLKTSKGLCVIQSDSSLFCDASVTTGTNFGSDGLMLQYDGSSTFGAAAVPTGQSQQLLYASSTEPVLVTLQWVAKC